MLSKTLFVNKKNLLKCITIPIIKATVIMKEFLKSSVCLYSTRITIFICSTAYFHKKSPLDVLLFLDISNFYKYIYTGISFLEMFSCCSEGLVKGSEETKKDSGGKEV